MHTLWFPSRDRSPLCAPGDWCQPVVERALHASKPGLLQNLGLTLHWESSLVLPPTSMKVLPCVLTHYQTRPNQHTEDPELCSQHTQDLQHFLVCNAALGVAMML